MKIGPLEHFLLNTSNIPLASRGYIITSSFKNYYLVDTIKKEEYRLVRDLMDGKRDITSEDFKNYLLHSVSLTPAPHVKVTELEQEFYRYAEVVRLSLQTFDKGLHIMVFRREHVPKLF